MAGARRKARCVQKRFWGMFWRDTGAAGVTVRASRVFEASTGSDGVELRQRKLQTGLNAAALIARGISLVALRRALVVQASWRNPSRLAKVDLQQFRLLGLRLVPGASWQTAFGKS